MSLFVRATKVTVNPGDSIQAALDAMSGIGGIVQLGAGTYNLTAKLTMYSNVTLRGMGRATVIHMAAATDVNHLGGGQQIMDVTGVDSCVIEDVAFTSDGTFIAGTYSTAGRAAIWADVSAACTNSIFRGCFIDGVATTGIAGTFTNCQIVNNSIIGTLEHGIYLSYSSETLVQGNNLKTIGAIGSGAQCGVKVSNSSRCAVIGNTVDAPEHEGIMLESNSTACLISSNTVYSCPQRGVRITSAAGDSNTITGNTIATTSMEGIIVSGGNYHAITNNNVLSAASHGIRLATTCGNNISISGNTLVNTSGEVVFIEGGVNHSVFGNYVTSSTAQAIRVNAGASRVAIRNNVIGQVLAGGWAILIYGASHIVADNTVAACDYGLNVAAGATNVLAVNNTFIGPANSSRFYSDAGTGTIIVESNKTGIALLGSATIDMKTAASTTIFTTPSNRVTRITHVIVRDATGSLAGGTSYSVTDFRAAFSLANLITSGTGYMVVAAADGTQYVEVAPSTAVQLTVTTGSTGAANATIDVFGTTTEYPA